MLDIELFIQKINKKSRLIGIDPGGKRIGIAISDENKIVATPYTTLIKENYSKLLLEIKKIFKENKTKKKKTCCMVLISFSAMSGRFI